VGEANPTFGLSRLTPMDELPRSAYFCRNLRSPS